MEPEDNKIDFNTDEGVQERLLNAAEQLFCEHGFKGTSIRDIAALAGCNIASVNYYFGGKKSLYIEVWRRHLIPMRDVRIAGIEKVMSQNQGGIKIEDLLRSFADSYVGSMIDPDKTSQLSKLMAREYIDRNLPTRIFVNEVITPTVEAIRGALIKTCPDVDESKVLLIIFSFVGQLVHLIHLKTIFEQEEENLALPVIDLNEAIDHIVKFTAAGIKAYSKG